MRIFSEARTLPPGEATLRTTALTVESALTEEIMPANLSPATSCLSLPSMISPSAKIMAILRLAVEAVCALT